MFKYIYGLQKKWPLIVRLHETDKVEYKKATLCEMVLLPDGRKGVIDHIKRDGLLGVRPVDDRGNYFPNQTAHWSMEDRLKVPEEVSISREAVKPIG